tara:strand:- start:103 stop:378 length:276 start_codon:yes stop_codon:yes gene_type:complete
MTLEYITFQISAKYLWGYRSNINVNNYNTIQEIITDVLKKYKEFLQKNNLLDLLDLLKTTEKKYHIHDYSIQNIKSILEPTEIVYICNHPH